MDNTPMPAAAPMAQKPMDQKPAAKGKRNPFASVLPIAVMAFALVAFILLVWLAIE